MTRRAHRGGSRARRPEKRENTAPPRQPRGLVWTGSVSFGLVNIPVTLHSGDAARQLPLSLLDRRDMSPIGYRKINKNTGEEVAGKDVVKGYKYAPHRYVIVSEEDFRRASPERTQRIDILRFVDPERIDPAFFERPYYLEPAAKSEKPFALLREAMRRARKAAVATLVLRARQHLALLIPRGRALVLELMRYSRELRDPEELHLPGEDLSGLGITKEELDMAGRLIEQLSGRWEPERYRDEYREELMSFIERKAKQGGVEVQPEAERERPAQAPRDIMELLKKSLARRAT